MQYFSQLNPLWAYQTYYNGFKFKDYGCFVTSLAMLCDKTPPETAKILREHTCFDAQGLLNSMCASSALGIEYYGKSTTRPSYTTIAETDYFAPNTPQHFFVITPEGKIYDPLGKNINYPIKSYRLFKPKETTMSTDFRGPLINMVTKFYIQFKGVKPPQEDVDAHVQVIMNGLQGSNPNNAISDWIGNFMAEPSVQAYIKSQCTITDCPECPPCTCDLEIEEYKEKLRHDLVP